MIAALARETIGAAQEVSSVDAIRRYGFGPEKCFDCIVAQNGGSVVAAVVFYDEFSTWRGKKGVYILDIYIDASARGLGLGRRLVAQVTELARARGAFYVRLSVDQENRKATSFYQAIGFEEGAHDRVFILSGAAFDAIGGD